LFFYVIEYHQSMSYKMPIVDMKWKKVKDITLSSELFSDEHINQSLIHEYVVMYLSNQRQSSANTKTRGEVKRSGRKLHNQKWSGRARVGDAGSPIRRSGGVAMWPRAERNRSKDMPAKMKKKALCGAISLKAKSSVLSSLEDYTTKSAKTKDAATLLEAIGLKWQKVLIVLDSANELIEKSFRNISGISYTTSARLNAYDVMCAKHVLFVSWAFDVLHERLSK